MLGYIKTIFNRQPIHFYNREKVRHYIEIYIQSGHAYEKVELEVCSRDPQLIIDKLKNEANNFDKFVKVVFFDRIETRKNRKITLGKKVNCSGGYYFGKRLTMAEFASINRSRGIYDNFMTYDEYQLGGVLHIKSGLISPIYGNDIVIDSGLEMPNENLEEHKRLIKTVLNDMQFVR